MYFVLKRVSPFLWVDWYTSSICDFWWTYWMSFRGPLNYYWLSCASCESVITLNKYTRWRVRLSRKFAVSIPGGVIGIFHWHNPGSTHPLTEVSIRNISLVGKGGRCLGLTTLPPSCSDCLEIWEPQPTGNITACPDLHRDCFTSTYVCVCVLYIYI